MKQNFKKNTYIILQVHNLILKGHKFLPKVLTSNDLLKWIIFHVLFALKMIYSLNGIVRCLS